jgi:hypothetical protein
MSTPRQYHHCRQCRSKLPRPTENHRQAFCSKDCHRKFYLHHCLVCERDTPPKSPDDRSLNLHSAKCRRAYTSNREMYQFRPLQMAEMEHDPISDLDGAKSPTGRGTQDRQFDRSSIVSVPVDLIEGRNPFGGTLPRELAQAILATELPSSRVTQFNLHADKPVRSFPGLTPAQLEAVRSDFRFRFPDHTPSQLDDRIIAVLSGREPLNPDGASARYLRGRQEQESPSVQHEQLTPDIPEFLRRSRL